MRTLTVIWLLTGTLWGATAKSPPNCSTRPCTYTITCAAATCTVGEVNEIQAAYNDAELGDTIKLQAGRVWPLVANSVLLEGRPGSSGYITITSTLDNRLPPRGVRITPAYREVMPILRANSTGAQIAFGMTGNANPARNVRLVGLWFETGQNNLAQAPLVIGNPNTFYGYTISNSLEQPNDIWVERCVFLTDALNQVGHQIRFASRKVTLLDNWFGPTTKLNHEGQVLLLGDGVGPVNAFNNYISHGTENVLVGGDSNDAGMGAAYTGEFAYNVFEKEPLRQKRENWSSGMEIWKGRVLRKSDGTSYFQAQNRGTTGLVEPTWPESGTVDDNGITWMVVSQDHTVKNLFETKNSKGFHLHHNTFQYTWEANQSGAFGFHLSNCAGSVCRFIPRLEGFCNTNGTSVTWVSGDPLPQNWRPSDRDDGYDPLTIQINGVDYPISDFRYGHDFEIALASSAGVQTNVPFVYGRPDVARAWNRDLRFEYNYVRHVPNVLDIAQFHNAQYQQVGNYTIRNNLLEDVSCTTYGTCNTNSGSFLKLANIPGGLDVRNNTAIECDGDWGCISLHNWNEEWCSLNPGCGPQPVFVDNLIARSVYGSSTVGILGDYAGTTEGASIAYFLNANNTPVPTAIFDNWVIAGANGSDFSQELGDVHTLCTDTGHQCPPDWDYDDPVYGKLFNNFGKNDYSVRESHYAKRSGTDGRDWGADMEQLPRLENIRVTPTDDKALLTWKVSSALADQTCSVVVSTSPDPLDYNSIVTDLSAAAFTTPDSDQNFSTVTNRRLRRFVAGHNTALSPLTKHFYWLHCGGGYETGSFKTRPTLTGTRQVSHTFQRESGDYGLKYGTEYDPDSDTISGSTTPYVPCAGTCTVEFTGDRGEVYFYRIVKSGGGETNPVQTIAIQ